MESLLFKVKRRGRRWRRGLSHPSMLPMLRLLAARRRARHRHERPGIPTIEQIIDPARNDPSEPDLTGTGIPPVIFQTWKSKTAVPDNYSVWRWSFFTHNPGYRIILWDDEDNRRFVREKFAWFIPVYDAYPREIFRVDAVRILFLLYFGGFYADMDTECVRPLDPLRVTDGPLLGRMGGDDEFDQSVPNAIMASAPRQLFWLFVIRTMIDKRDAASGDEELLRVGPETFTGPIALKQAFDAFSRLSEEEAWLACRPLLDLLDEPLRETIRYRSVTLLHPDEWYPVDWTNPIHRMLRASLMNTQRLFDETTVRTLFPHASMVTYWSRSWGDSVKATQ